MYAGPMKAPVRVSRVEMWSSRGGAHVQNLVGGVANAIASTRTASHAGFKPIAASSVHPELHFMHQRGARCPSRAHPRAWPHDFIGAGRANLGRVLRMVELAKARAFARAFANNEAALPAPLEPTNAGQARVSSDDSTKVLGRSPKREVWGTSEGGS
jgi:hypothetical protein